MSQINDNQKIINRFSLKEFFLQFGKMCVANFVNKETGEPFKSCTFTKGDEVTLVAFSKNLGVLTPQEIAARKYDLQIVQLESGNYKLCAKGENTWEEVDLGF